jgi:hypothetical protein
VRPTPGHQREEERQVAKRKTAQEVANENLATAERVHEKAKARVEKTRADAEKAVEDERLARRKARAARMVALDEETDQIEPDATPAAEPAGDDVL